MAGKRIKNHDLPPRMMVRKYTNKKSVTRIAYYYYGKRDASGRRECIPLGNDLHAAKRQWAELECKPVPATHWTIADVYSKYMAWAEDRTASGLSVRTLNDRKTYWRFLAPVYGAVDIDAIKPNHIMPYFNRRSSKVSAKKEIKFLSVVFNWARANGYMLVPNPISGITRQMKVKETREIYVQDEDIAMVYRHGSDTVRDAIELAYITGQRPADVRKMRWTDIRDGALEIVQNKTNTKLRIAIVGTFADLLNRIKNRGIIGQTILADQKGQPIREGGHLRNQFDKARDAAEAEAKELGLPFTRFQLRDIRAKSATDLDNIINAQKLLGHRTQNMTAAYIRKRKADVINPNGEKIFTIDNISEEKKKLSY